MKKADVHLKSKLLYSEVKAYIYFIMHDHTYFFTKQFYLDNSFLLERTLFQCFIELIKKEFIFYYDNSFFIGRGGPEASPIYVYEIPSPRVGKQGFFNQGLCLTTYNFLEISPILIIFFCYSNSTPWQVIACLLAALAMWLSVIFMMRYALKLLLMYKVSNVKEKFLFYRNYLLSL